MSLKDPKGKMHNFCFCFQVQSFPRHFQVLNVLENAWRLKYMRLRRNLWWKKHAKIRWFVCLQQLRNVFGNIFKLGEVMPILELNCFCGCHHYSPVALCGLNMDMNASHNGECKVHVMGNVKMWCFEFHAKFAHECNFMPSMMVQNRFDNVQILFLFT